MSRDSNGNYTLPAGNPVVADEYIESAWANATMTDIATALQDSLSRSGKGGMQAALKLFDGTVTVPGLNFSGETSSGWWRSAAGDVRMSILGVQKLRVTANAFTPAMPVDLPLGANIASAATVDLSAATGNSVHITGTTAITAVTLSSGQFRMVVFDGVLTLTHHATNNNLPGGANITTAAGDRALYYSDGTTVYCLSYISASGDQTIAGVKTFASKPVLPATAPTGNEAASASYVGSFNGPGIKQGLTLSNNATDATNDLDIATGKAVDSTGAVAMVLASAMTKRLDADWQAGTGNGGRYSGAAIANTTYHVWLVAKAAGADVDVYLNPSAVASTVLTNLQAESGGADYLYVWRIGSIMRESGVIVPFVQNFSEFQRKTPLMDIAASSTGTSAVLRTFAIPTGLKLIVKYYAYMRNSTGSGGNYNCYFSDPDVVDLAPSITTSPGVMGGDGPLLDSRQGMVFFTRTNTSAQIRTRAGDSSASATLYMSAHAWIDEGIYRS